jgi:hypothetical protein
MPHLLFIFAFLFFLVPQPACPLPLLFIVLEFSPLSSNWFFFPSYSWLWSSSVFPCSFFSWDKESKNRLDLVVVEVHNMEEAISDDSVLNCSSTLL